MQNRIYSPLLVCVHFFSFDARYAFAEEKAGSSSMPFGVIDRGKGKNRWEIEWRVAVRDYALLLFRQHLSFFWVTGLKLEREKNLHVMSSFISNYRTENALPG